MRDLRFSTVVDGYLDIYRGIYSVSTYGEVGRRLRRISSVVGNTILTSEDPRRWSPEDVLAVISGLRSKYELGAGSLRHLISDLNRLCLYRGNDAVQVARVRYPAAFPVHEGGHIESLSVSDRVRLLDFLCSTHTKDTFRICIPSVLALATGGRSMEIANLRVRDVDLKSGTVTFRIVKGLGTYGHSRTVPILPDCMHLVERAISSQHKDSLIVSNLASGCSLTTNSLRRMRQKVEASSGVRFEYRTLRRAYADSLRSMGLPVDAVSMFLGHCSSDTTEAYYYRLTESAAHELYRKCVQDRGKNFSAGIMGMVHPPGFDAMHNFPRIAATVSG